MIAFPVLVARSVSTQGTDTMALMAPVGLQNQLPVNADGSFSKAAVLSCALFRDAASAVIVGTRYALQCPRTQG